MTQPTKYVPTYEINLNSGEFKQTITDIITRFPEITEIVETGTYNGMGSTQVFAKTKKDVFTIECNQVNYNMAVSNLREYPNVCVFHGLSLPRNYLVSTLMMEDFNLDVKYDSTNPKPFYMREIAQPVVQEDCLSLLSNNERRQLLFLDSAGGVGFIEFNYIMKNFSPSAIKNKILVLDDCNHIKHKRSIEHLMRIGCEVHLSSDFRFGWCDLTTMGSVGDSVANITADEWMLRK